MWSVSVNSHDVLRLLPNLHVVTTWRNPDNVIRTKRRTTTRLKYLRLPCKMMMEVSKIQSAAPAHEKFNSSSENLAKVLRLSHKTTVGTLLDTWQCHEVPRLPKTAYDIIWPRLKPFQHESIFPIDTATPQENQRIEMRHIGLEAPNVHFAQDFLKFSLLVAPKSTFSYTFINVLHEPQNSLPQNRCFVRGFRQFSSNHMLQSANPAIRFARCHHLTHPWQCYSHKEDAQRVQSPAPATKNWTNLLKTWRTYCACNLMKTCCDVKVPRLPHETRLRDLWNLQKWLVFQDSQRHGHRDLIRTVANERLRNV